MSELLTDPHTRIVRSRAALNAARFADAIDAVIDVCGEHGWSAISLVELRMIRDEAKERERAA